MRHLARLAGALTFAGVTLFAAAGLSLAEEATAPATTAPAAETDAEVPAKASREPEQGTKSGLPVPSRFGAPPDDPAYGAFQRGLFVTARNLALPRAEAGDAAAQTLLGEIYSRGLGVAVDQTEAEKWYAMAAEQGNPEALFRHALTLLAGDAKSAEGRAFMEAAAEAGNALARFNLAQLILSERPGKAARDEAYPLFLAAAEAGVPDAQYAVARYHLEGDAPGGTDAGLARRFLEAAARQGFDTAQLDLGFFFLEGIDGKRDLQRGFALVHRAARAGNVVAQAEVAKLYWGGIGIEPDEVEAAAWTVLARRAGYDDAALEDFWLGLSTEAQQKGIERANRLAER